MKSILISIICILLIGSITPCWGSQLDQPSTWAQEDIKRLKAWGRMDASYFSKYQAPITRKEFAGLSVIVFEALSGSVSEGVSDELKKTFKDTQDYDVLQAWQLGIVKGDGQGYFKPEASITREQIALMMVTLTEKVGKPLQMTNKAQPLITDQQQISPWAESAVNICLNQGIMKGVGNGRMNPQGTVTREQAYKMIAALVAQKSTLNP